jgi:hypothetical protein
LGAERAGEMDRLQQDRTEREEREKAEAAVAEAEAAGALKAPTGTEPSAKPEMKSQA